MNRRNPMMRTIRSVFVILTLAFFLSGASAISDRPQVVPTAELMRIGAFYYPEQWPAEQWERDLRNLAAFGFEFTHFAEFSWVLLEPSEGKFVFAWLDRAVDLAARAGLKVILCTPTPCPPAWMGEKYPEIYLVGSDGRRREHGTRANASLTNPQYQAFVDRIVQALASRYGPDERIWGWQIDNEPPALPDYSPSARIAFRKWLQGRYGTIDRLNETWGGSFWSTRYDSFDQVLIPNPLFSGEDKLSPHALLDFQRFTADMTAAFLDRQADQIRNHARPGQWITSNYVNVCTEADPRRTDRLDLISFTLYPVRGQNELGGGSFRRGAPFRLTEALDYFRPIKGTTGVMELQPGQVNWAATNPQVQPGAIHMWIMHAFGGGSSFVCTYRYRHPLRGSEMYHDGIVGPDGTTLSPGGREFVQAIADMKKLRSFYKPGAVMPGKLARRRTAFLWSHDVMWDLDVQPQSASWNTWRHRNLYTAAIKSTGAPVDFISENDDFSIYPFLVAPAYQIVSADLVGKWRRYVEGGGHLILSCRSGQKDALGHLHEGPFAAPLQPLTGAAVEFFDMLLPDGHGEVGADNRRYPWHVWADVLKPADGTEVLAAYADQFYAGKAAAVTRKLGKGSVTYIGVESDDGLLERDLVRGVYRRAGVAIEDLPKGVYLEWRDGFWVAVNYANEPASLPLPAKATVLVGTPPLKPGACLIWREDEPLLVIK